MSKISLEIAVIGVTGHPEINVPIDVGYCSRIKLAPGNSPQLSTPCKPEQIFNLTHSHDLLRVQPAKPPHHLSLGFGLKMFRS